MQKISPFHRTASSYVSRIEAPTPPLIFSQPYRYFARGQQCYVFESLDNQFVIKFFRLPKFSPSFLSYLPFLSKKGEKDYRKRQWNHLLDSLRIAKEKLGLESGLIYTHLKLSDNLNTSLTLIDPLGRRNQVFLDDYYFIVQKKAELFGPLLLKLYKEKKEKKIQELLISFIDTVHHRVDIKVRNKNRNCMKNLGIIQNRVVEFDVGELSALKTNREKEVEKSFRQFRKFLSHKMPEYLSYFDQHAL